ncbi:hypothetical protein [Xanthomonas phage Xp15]|uniref:SGNH hydrolase-type esterase domain-containing protein n=1 Tax=Xanthomonas phage Xp15 TaxID=322855 RepID=Q52PM7_9CAUD|nr:hypothetical protein XPXV15_gp04 [Xanthomonas phage Xp15]AAX84849.1 hypothetical protein [Xanthomonas phage Xp15]
MPPTEALSRPIRRPNSCGRWGLRISPSPMCSGATPSSPPSGRPWYSGLQGPTPSAFSRAPRLCPWRSGANMTVIRRRISKPGAVRRSLSRSVGGAIAGALSARGSGNFVPPPVISDLMIASMNGITPHNLQDSQNFDNHVARWIYTTGSGKLKSLALRFDAWFINATSAITNTSNPIPIFDASLEYNGVVVPVTFGNIRSKTLQPGDFDVLSDEIQVSAFGVTNIPRGSNVSLKIRYTFPGASANRMLIGLQRPESQGGQCRWFNAANTTVSSTDAPGPYTFTGTAPTARQGSYRPGLLGRYEGAFEPIWLFYGDSITMGTGDSDYTRNYGIGWPAEACRIASPNGGLSYGNMAIHGSSTAMSTFGEKIEAPLKYATHVHIGWGTNDFGTSAADPRPTSQPRLTAGVNSMKARPGSKVTNWYFGYLGPRTTTTDNYVTEENQSYLTANWGPSPCNVESWNSWLVTNFSPNGVNTWPSIRGVDPLKWRVNGTARYSNTDDAHPSTVGHLLMGQDAAAMMRANQGVSLA